ncbi:Hpt domain-containing protein [Ralstonia solanacearum]|uniref:Hpt domain-containing protein n=1 Tax=Ralstonia solanacearum TaxID=305 RepID=A0AAD0SCQ2_RALSL|nr:Hpt domain-containing protein [Ralstonia solanacearum]AXV84114.1 Hpt domain-containing protein [Ralstonia solanacearum]AXW55245.1 Hpt domain-containing protein [Ralstonia solanacearum]CBJ35409.1 conserved hypothethical protein, Histidine-containing phosphotransfer domain, HPT domain [Ralstonia solanacearum PSI07]
MQPRHPATTPIESTPRAGACPAIADILPAQIVITLTELFDADLRQWRDLIDLFCHTVMQDLANLEAAIARGAVADIATAAHRIVGSARMLGHAPIGDAAHAVERIVQSDDNGRARPADLQYAFVGLRMQIDAFRQRACRCAWPDAGVPG